MKLFALGFLLGSSAVYLFHHTPSLAWGLGLFLISLGCLAGLCFAKRGRALLVIGLGISLSMSWWMANLIFFTSPPLPKNLEKQNLSLVATILNIQKTTPEGVTFLAKANHRHLLLSWYQDPPDLELGQRWQLQVRLKRIHGFANPAGMDFEKLAFSEGISASGYVVSGANNHLLGETKQPLTRLRAHLYRQMSALLPPDEMSPYLIALALGLRQGLSSQGWTILQNTGTAHLMAIAGLHIGMATLIVMLSFGLVWRVFPPLHYFTRQQFSAVGGLATALFYSSLAGFSLPTQRALVMLSVVLIAILLKRYLRPLTGFSLALIAVLCLDPLAVLSISFWLSFGAVGSIIYGLSLVSCRRKWAQHFYLQGIITLGILPFSLYFFQKLSLISPIANLIVVPWVGFVVVPLCLLSIVLLLLHLALIAKAILWLAHWNMIWVMKYLGVLSTLPLSNTNLSFVHPWEIFFLCLSFAFLLLPRKFPGKHLGLFFLIPVIFPWTTAPPVGEIKMTVLDVGQGLAVLIQTAHHAVIYDTGPKFASGLDAGEAVLSPMLLANRIQHLDLLIVSHSDNDHSGGAAYILDHFKVSKFLTSDPGFFQGRKVELCKAGQQWSWDGISFEIIYPPQNLFMKKNNNRSCVLKITVGAHSLLLPGDIEKPAERVLLTEGKLSADVLLAPHHGSQTSSTEPFIEAIHPDWVIFSTGYLNRFHFPSPLVAARYQAAGAHSLNTAETGAITLQLSPSHIHVEPFRQTHPEIWRTEPSPCPLP